MTIDQTLQYLEDFRSRLELWGVTPRTLWITAAIAGILFIVTLREVLTWYLRVQFLTREIAKMRVQLSEVQSGIAQLLARAQKSDSEPDTDDIPSSGNLLKPNGSSKFRLDH